MDELIGQLASKAGIDNVVAEKTIGIMQGFLRSEGLSDKVPGAEAAIAAASTGGGHGKSTGNDMIAVGTRLMIAVGTRLMALGPGMDEIQNIACELSRLSPDKIGANQMGEIITGTPGLSQFA